MNRVRSAKTLKPFRHSLLALTIACLVSGCGIVLVTTATVMAIDIARDRRGASVYWDDNKMELDIARSIDKQKQIEHEHVNVTVYNGVVLLTGEVPDQRDIDSIIDLAKSHQGSRQVINRLGVDPNRVVTVSVGAETIASAPSVPAGPPTVLYSAATHPHKNHCLLVEAFDRVAARHPDTRLVLTGGRGAAETDVARVIATAEHAGRIDRTGRIPAADLARHLADADVVAFPSTYEGFGIPVLEAMAAGVAVLVADGTPAADLVQGCNAVVGAGDPAAWAEALDRLLADRDHRNALAARVLAAARDRTWEASAAALERAWRLLLGRSAPAGRRA